MEFTHQVICCPNFWCTSVYVHFSILLVQIIISSIIPSLADPGGASNETQFFGFAYVFAKKRLSCRLVPPNGSAPPQREILDPLLRINWLNYMLNIYERGFV